MNRSASAGDGGLSSLRLASMQLEKAVNGKVWNEAAQMCQAATVMTAGKAPAAATKPAYRARKVAQWEVIINRMLDNSSRITRRSPVHGAPRSS